MDARQVAVVVSGRPVAVCATGSAVSGGPRTAESKADLVGRPMAGSKAFVGRRDFQRLGKVVEGSKNFTVIKDQVKWNQRTPLDQ